MAEKIGRVCLDGKKYEVLYNKKTKGVFVRCGQTTPVGQAASKNEAKRLAKKWVSKKSPHE